MAFIDAQSGVIINWYDNLQTARNRRTHTANNGTSLPGTLDRTESSGPSGDTVLDEAHDNAGFTYDYYSQAFGRDSYNNSGATITSTVHYSNNYVNAFWNGTQMVYGNGDGVNASPLVSLDVVAHELTHAVTSSESNLVYHNESGALNEALSDIFGASIEAFRDGGEGGTHPRGKTTNVVPGIGIDKAAAIFYRANTTYLTSNSGFGAARTATVNAATDLYGQAEIDAVNAAWDAVGAPGGGGDPGPGPGGDNSCQGNCGGSAPSGCFCDFWCLFFGDCCADYTDACL